MATKIILITDPHITVAGDVRGVESLSRLQLAIDDILENHADAVMSIILGDIAHRGDIDSYRLAAAQLSRLPMPFHLLPGNHDNRDHLRQVFPALPPGFIQQVVRCAAGDFILLDSVCEGAVTGEFCAVRGQWLRQVLRAARRPVFIAMHHPPMPLPNLQLGEIMREDAKELAAIIGEFADRVRYLFFGHMHATVDGAWQNTPFAVLRGTAHQAYFSPRQTASYRYTKAAPHYGVLMVCEQQVILHHHGFLENTPVDDDAVGMI